MDKMSLLTIEGAAFRVKGFIRFLYHRKAVREDVRQQYSRFFDGRSKRHFYVFHRTGEVRPSICCDSLSWYMVTQENYCIVVYQQHYA